MMYKEFKKIFSVEQETINTGDRQPTEWENIFSNSIADQGVIL